MAQFNSQNEPINHFSTIWSQIQRTPSSHWKKNIVPLACCDIYPLHVFTPATAHRLLNRWKWAETFLKRHETVTNPSVPTIVLVPRSATWPNPSISDPDPSRPLPRWNQSSMCTRCVSLSYASTEPAVIYQSRLGGRWESETRPDTRA